MTETEQLAALREFVDEFATPGPHEHERCQMVDERHRAHRCPRCEANELLAKLDAPPVDDRWIQVSPEVGIGMAVTCEGNWWYVYDYGRMVDNRVTKLSKAEALESANAYIAKLRQTGRRDDYR